MGRVRVPEQVSKLISKDVREDPKKDAGGDLKSQQDCKCSLIR